MDAKTKAAMMSRLTEIFNSTTSKQTTCLSSIAICMLDAVTTDERLSRHFRSGQSQSSEQDASDQVSLQQSKGNSTD